MKVYDKTGNEIDLTVKNDISSIQNIITPVTEGSTSLNDMQTTGIFRIYDVNTETPISNANGLLFVLALLNAGTFGQLYVHYNGDTYMRMKWYGCFSDWVKLNN